MQIQYSVIDAPLGPIYVAETKEGVVQVTLGPEGLSQLAAFARRWFPGAQVVPSVVDACVQIEEYLGGGRREFDLPLSMKGTAFQAEVWQALARIPYGSTRTYHQVAEDIGRRAAARAVGQACGANPVPLLIPCHRVVTSQGGLGGFGAGLEWKKWLLDLENNPTGK